MAVVVRFVNPGADASGDGTTKELTSGDSTHAYDNLATWEAAEQADLTSGGDTHIVKCAGTTADDTAVVLAGWTTDSGDFITIQGDRDQSDGFYNGVLQYNTSFYRIEQTVASITLLIGQDFTVVDGIQIKATKTGSFVEGIQLGTFDDVDVKNCRIITAINGSTRIGISNVGGLAGGEFARITNNIIAGWVGGGSAGYKSAMESFFVGKSFVYNNAIYDCDTGILELDIDASTELVSKNNTLFNNVDDHGGTVTIVNCGTDQGAGEGTAGQDIGTPTDHMVDPENATADSRDVTPITSGLLDDNGLGSGSDAEVPTVDIIGTSRSTTAPEIGPWELAKDNITLATLTSVLNTAPTGFTDVTKADFGPPVAALIFVSGATGIDTVTDGADISIGFSTFGAGEHLSISQQDEHASVKVDCDARKNTNTAYSLLDAAGITKVGGRVTTITNGVRLTNTSNEAGLANRFTAVLFGGSDVAADLRNSAIAATQDVTATITHAGMTDGNDKIIFFIGSGTSLEDSSSSGIDNSFGWCHISGSDAGGYTFVQRCVGWASDHNNNDGSPASVTENNRCLKILMETGTDDWGLEVTAYSHSSNTITITTRDSAAGAGLEVYSLIIDLFDRKAFVGDVSAPTAGPPANFVVTGLGFKPRHVGMFLTQGQTISGIDTDLDGGSLGISNVSGAGEETCHSWYNEDAAAVINTANVFADHAIQFHDDDTATLLQDHDFQSFDTDGFTYDIVAENETLSRNWPLWAISELAPAPPAGRIMSSLVAAGGLVAGGGLAGAGGGLVG